MRLAIAAACALTLGVCLAEDVQLERAKLELLVEQSGELLAEANRPGSETHSAPYQYFFGLMHATGTNLLARTEGTRTAQLRRQYMKLIDRNYEAYTRVAEAADKAAATGGDRVHAGRHVIVSGSRRRAKRLANVEKLRDKELTEAIRQWENFAVQVKKAK